VTTTIGDEGTAVPIDAPQDGTEAPSRIGDDDGSARRRPVEVLADWAPVIVGLLPLLVMLLIGLWSVSSSRAPAADLAILEISTRNALRGRQLLGAYSRYGWNHPGPAMFYWFAPFYRLTGSELGSLAVASITMSCICVGLIVRTVQRMAGRAAAWATAAAMPVFIWLVGFDRVQSPWNPDVLLIAMGALGVVGAAAVLGRRWALPTAAFLACWVSQAHLGAIPLALALCAFFIAFTVWRQRRELVRWIVPAVLALAVTGAMWAPVIWENNTRTPGNVTKIREFYEKDDGSEAHPWQQSANAVAAAVVGRHWNFADGEPLPVEWQVGAAALVGTVSVGAVSGWLRRRRGGPLDFQTVVCTIGLLAVPVALVSVRNVRGPIYGYILSFAVGLGFLLWTAAAVTIAGFVSAGARDERLSARAPAIRRAAIGLAAAVAVAVTIRVPDNGGWNRSWAEPRGQYEIYHRLGVDNVQVRTVADAALESPLVDSGDRVEVEWAGVGWEIGSGVVNMLEKHGVRAKAKGDAGGILLFDERQLTDGSETARVVMLQIGPDGEVPDHSPERPSERYRVDDGHNYEVYVVPLEN
jgi:hypothetical protein